ncbi:MAG TPA: VCBS repeat-containing protein, partial [Methylomirabilota bacterium]|nr:VCBS repeat-containing protein [Methylomirabilota bacterium]
DFDHDGNLDFVAIYNLDEKGLTLRRGHGDGGFFLPRHYHGSFQWDDYTTGGRTQVIDVDGDGHQDVLFANVQAQDFSYWKNNGDGTFREVRRFGAGHNVHDLVAGDFNGDGALDVAMSAQVDVGAWWYTGVVIIDGTAGTPPLPGDVDGDGLVGIADLLALLAAWGPCTGACPADFDGDGAVGITDLLIVLANWS